MELSVRPKAAPSQCSRGGAVRSRDQQAEDGFDAA